MSRNPIEGSQRLNKNARARVPLRVAPRMKPQVRNMRTRSKKNTLSGRK